MSPEGVRPMSSLIKISWVFFLILSASAAVDAQSAEQTDAYRNRADSLYSKGQYLEAAGLYEKSAAVEKARPEPRLTDWAVTLNRLGDCYRQVGRYEQALVRYEEALAIHERLGKEEEIAATLRNIGSVYKLLGQDEQAQEYYEEAASIKEAVIEEAIVSGGRGDATEETLSTLSRALKSEDGIIQYEAIFASREIGERGVPVLVEALGFEEVGERLRDEILKALYDIGEPAIPGLLRALGTSRDKESSKAIAFFFSMMRLMDRPVVPALVEALRHEDTVVVLGAVLVLGVIGKESVPALVEALKHEDAQVRAGVGGALATMAARDTTGIGVAVPALIATLRDPETPVRSLAADALGRLQAVAAVPALFEILRDEDERVQKSAVDALSRIGEGAAPALIKVLTTVSGAIDTEMVQGLIGALKHEEAQVRAGAAITLGALGAEAEVAVPGLIVALRDRETSVCYAAVIALGKIGAGAAEAVPGLLAASKDEDMQKSALYALSEIGDAAVLPLVAALSNEEMVAEASVALIVIGQAAVPALIGALEEEELRNKATIILGKMGEIAVPALIEAMRDEETRRGAANALILIGEAAVPALLAALQDEDNQVRVRATAALTRLGDVETIANTDEELLARDKVGIHLALFYEGRGDYAKAEAVYKRTLQLVEKILGPDHPDLAVALNNLGDLYTKLGKFSAAESLLERALEIDEKNLGPEHLEVAATLNNLAMVYFYQFEFAQAEELLKRALRIQEEADHPDRSHTLNNLAEVYRFQGRSAEVALLLQEALDIAEKNLGPDHAHVAVFINNLALLRHQQGNLQEAEVLYKRSVVITEQALGSNSAQLAYFLASLAELEKDMDHPREALFLLQRALAVHKRTLDNVFASASEREKFAFLSTVEFQFDVLIKLIAQDLATDPEAVRAALDATLWRKGLVLEVLSRERQALLASDDPQTAVVAEELQAVTFQLADLNLAGPGELPMETYRNQLEMLKAERDSLEETLARLSDSYKAERHSQQADARSVGQSLESGSTLVEYVGYRVLDLQAATEEEVLVHRYLACVLPAGERNQPILIDLGKAAPIDAAVGAFRRDVAQASRHISRYGEAEAEQRLQEKGRRIYDLVFAPLEDALGGNKVVYLAPDSELNLIPFDVLVDEEGRYLVETYQFNYLSSGRDLLGFDKAGAVGSGAVVLANPDYGWRPSRTSPAPDRQSLVQQDGQKRSGDLREMWWSPLEGTAREAKAIVEVLDNVPVEVFLEERAVEAVVKNVQSPRILHLATHGFFLVDQERVAWPQSAPSGRGAILAGTKDGLQQPGSRPAGGTIENPLLRSGLVLAGANHLGITPGDSGMEDGILTALEISGMDLWNTDLVVLSACETGVGETRLGEGVFGLRRAFQLAGARSVVMSLWSIPDVETAALMEGFYRRLQSGKGKAAALRQAVLEQLEIRRQRQGFAHPFYWGAFVCVGEP